MGKQSIQQGKQLQRHTHCLLAYAQSGLRPRKHFKNEQSNALALSEKTNQ